MKGKQGLIISLLLGVFAATFAYSYLKKREKELLDLSAPVRVVVAAKDILENQRVDDLMVEFVEVPKKYKQPGAITDIKEVTGQVTTAPIRKGEQILRTKLLDFGLETGLAFKVPPGMRGVTVAVDDVTGVAGLIRPGNLVDVFGTFQIRLDKERVSATELLLQNIEVLAVERKMTAITPEQLAQLEAEREEAEKRGGMARKRDEYPKNVTLAIAPKDAARIVTALDSGLITLVLRSQYEDAQALKIDQVTTNDLLGKGKAVPKYTAGPAWREIRGTEESYGYR